MGDNRFNLRRFVVVIVYFMLLLSFSGPSSRTLEQVASLPVSVALRQMVLWHAALKVLNWVPVEPGRTA